MNPLTYRKLLEALPELTEEQLDMSVTIVLDDEMYPIWDTHMAWDLLEITSGVLQPDQPILLADIDLWNKLNPAQLSS
jgi:hypothetical protein